MSDPLVSDLTDLLVKELRTILLCRYRHQHDPNHLRVDVEVIDEHAEDAIGEYACPADGLIYSLTLQHLPQGDVVSASPLPMFYAWRENETTWVACAELPAQNHEGSTLQVSEEASSAGEALDEAFQLWLVLKDLDFTILTHR